MIGTPASCIALIAARVLAIASWLLRCAASANRWQSRDIGITIFIDDTTPGSITTFTPAGRFVVVFATVVYEHMRLTSCYHGSGDRSRTSVVHLHQPSLIGPGESGLSAYRVLETMPGQEHASSCLLNHVAEVQQLLSTQLDGHVVQVDVSPAAIADVDEVWEDRDLGA